MAGTPIYSLINDGGGKFAIIGNSIVVAAPLDYEEASSYNLTVAVSGVVPSVNNKAFTINVIDVIEPLIEMTGGSVLETALIGTSVATFTVASTFGTPVFTLVNDAGGRFSLVGNTLKVAAELDYEISGFHNVTIGVSGVTPIFANKTFTITVVDVGAGTIILSNSTLAENADRGTLIGALSVHLGAGTYTFTIVNDPDDIFSLDSGNLSGTGELNYEVATSHQVTIRADNGIEPITQTLTINVLDIDEGAPIVTAFSPSDNSFGVSLSTNLVATFNEQIVLGPAGIISLKRTLDDSLVKSWNLLVDSGTTAGKVNVVGGTQLTIRLSANLTDATQYYVLWDAGVVRDVDNNANAALSDHTLWSFSTATVPARESIFVPGIYINQSTLRQWGTLFGTYISELSYTDTSAPVALTYSPADDATGVVLSTTSLTVTFNEVVSFGTGTINLKKTSDSSLVESWNVATEVGNTSGKVEIIGGTQVRMYLTSSLLINTGYYVVWDAGIVKDNANNSVAALSSTTTWSFATTSSAVTRQAMFFNTYINQAANRQWVSPHDIYINEVF